MNNPNIFQKEIIIPDIVRTKAEDVLANLPDLPAATRSSDETKRKKKRMLIRVVAFASAAAAAALIFFVARNQFARKKSKANPFAITVNAQEMEDGGSLPLTYPNDFLAEKGISCGPETCEFSLGFDVQGEDVKSVEYSFYNSFAEVQHKGIGPSDNFHGIEIKPYYADYFEVIPDYNPRNYGSYTINYPFTDKKFFEFFLVKEIIDRPDLEQMYYDLEPEVLNETIMPDGSIRQEVMPPSDEEIVEYYNAIFEDVVVTITVHFSDGAVETRYVGFRGDMIEQRWTLDDGTEDSWLYPGIECFFLTGEEVKKIDFEHPVIQYEETKKC